MSELERASYTCGWPREDRDVPAGNIELRCGGQILGSFPVQGARWHWVPLDAGVVTLPKRETALELSTSSRGLAVDVLCITNDTDFQRERWSSLYCWRHSELLPSPPGTSIWIPLLPWQ